MDVLVPISQVYNTTQALVFTSHLTWRSEYGVLKTPQVLTAQRPALECQAALGHLSRRRPHPAAGRHGVLGYYVPTVQSQAACCGYTREVRYRDDIGRLQVVAPISGVLAAAGGMAGQRGCAPHSSTVCSQATVCSGCKVRLRAMGSADTQGSIGCHRKARATGVEPGGKVV